jgi:hypothetical protein
MSRVEIVAIVVATAAAGVFVLSLSSKPSFESPQGHEDLRSSGLSSGDPKADPLAAIAGQNDRSMARGANRPQAGELRRGVDVARGSREVPLEQSRRGSNQVMVRNEGGRPRADRPRGAAAHVEPRGSLQGEWEGASDPGGFRQASGRDEVVSFLKERREVLETPPELGAPEAAEEEDVLLSVPLDGFVGAEGATQPVAEENLYVDEETGSVEFPEDSVLEFPNAGNIQSNGGTVSLEIEPNWNGTDDGDNSFVQVREEKQWAGKMSIFRNGDHLRFIWFDSNAQEQGVAANITNWQAGEPHSVTATWGDALMQLYVDGKLVGQTTYAGELVIPPGTPLFLGSNPQHHVPGADAILRNFKAYGRPLTAEEVFHGGPLEAKGGGESTS